ncbi:type II secretion system F family protein [Glaciihabitans sp. INWT7]|uniref:type II secretion system F family protein n=1 Tax=Glaciihabitans sp. INWT7 TaxID=2596912 RepID=UPI001625D471|nr:type II secretion system F family protein [Glaciihabitans sp. INWT7]
MRRDRRVDLEPLAAVVQRLGVLLAAGVAPASGWAYVAEAAHGSAAAGARAVADVAARGGSVTEAIVSVASARRADRAAWRGLAAAWLVATEAGAPLAPTLSELSATLRSLAQNQRDVETALAGPVATARMVMVLPAVGILFGLALGFDSLHVLVATPPGLVCLALGILLMGLAQLWNRKLLRGARPTNLTPGLTLDLMAIAVSGGASLSRAQGAVAGAREACGIDPDDGDAAIAEVLELSRRAGVPAAALLRAEAVEARRSARSAGERAAATLGVTLMLPLGVCILPAFMLLGVAPLLIAVLSSTVTGL